MPRPSRTWFEACGRLACPLIQISTDYLFGAVCGAGRAWREDDPPSPQGVYARTKWEGEQAARRHPQHLIVRTCGLYARPSDSRAANFVRTMLRLGETRAELRVVADQQCTPTYVPHLARALRFLAGAATGHPAPWGTYHVTNTGQTTWQEFATEIFRQAGKPITIHPITTAQYGARPPGPRTVCSTRPPITGWAARPCPTGKRRWPSILPSGGNCKRRRKPDHVIG